MWNTTPVLSVFFNHFNINVGKDIYHHRHYCNSNSSLVFAIHYFLDATEVAVGIGKSEPLIKSFMSLFFERSAESANSRFP